MDTESFHQEQRSQDQHLRHARRIQATRDFTAAQTLAAETGMALIHHTDSHYTLRADDWIIDLHPGNQRVSRKKEHLGAPFLRLPRGRDWTLKDVVTAAVAARRKKQREEGLAGGVDT